MLGTWGLAAQGLFRQPGRSSAVGMVPVMLVAMVLEVMHNRGWVLHHDSV